MPYMYDKDVTDEEGLRTLVSRSAERCPAFDVQMSANMPRYCPLAVQIMRLLDIEHPVFAGPYLGFLCGNYSNKNKSEKCPIQERAEEAALTVYLKKASDKSGKSAQERD